jgi:hypothetical protein
MGEVNARMMIVVEAIRHSILTSNSPGLSVNTHPNPFMLNVIGTVDMQTAAEEAIKRLDIYDAAQAKKQQEADAATAASAVDGH